jgi:ABC-type multidrug transport system fused ATPase/permease subunit
MGNGKWLLSYANRAKWLILFTIILLIIEILANLSLIGIQKFIIDDVFLNEHYELLVPLLAALAGLAIVYNVLHLYAAQVMQKSTQFLQKILVREMMNYLQRIPISLFRKERTGKFVQNLTGDINQVSGTVASQIPTGIMELSSAILLSVLIGIANPIILVSIMSVSCLYIALGHYFSPKVRKANKATMEERTAVLVNIEEGISSTREVIAFHRQDWEKNKYHRLFERYFSKVMHENKLNNQQILITEPLKWLINLIVLGYGGYSVIQGSLSIGEFVVIYQFSSRLLNSYQSVFRFFMSMSGNMAAVERVRGLLEGETIETGSERLNAPIQSLSFKNVRFQYEDNTQPTLNDVNVDIPIGKKVAFVGTSGGGKSTIAQLLIRFYHPNYGEIIVNGKPLSRILNNDWMEKVRIVFQEPYLFPDTIRNNLLMGCNISENEMIHICQKMQIHDFVMSLPEGYETEVGERGIKLSGGQRQRVAIARALLSDAEILIMDEATSALDLETERQIQKHLDELCRDKSIIVIAHRLSTVMNSDIIYVMDKGRIVEQGTHEQLMDNSEVYRDLVTAQEKIEIRLRA